jgi:nitrous oxidase accessory protein NosD
MKKTRMVLTMAALTALTGCVSQTQFLDSKQGMAIQTATGKAQFELNCQETQATVISREVIEPALQGRFMNGIQRAEFTIGVRGCDKKAMFVVICPDGGEGCFAAGPGGFHREF